MKTTKSPEEASRVTTIKKIQGHLHKCSKGYAGILLWPRLLPSDRLPAAWDNSECPMLLTNLDQPFSSDWIEITRQAHPWGILLHDNARLHMANTIMALLQKFKWEVLVHPPYIPDCSPCDYAIFGPITKALRGIRFTSDDNVKQYMRNWLTMQPREFYETAIHCLVSQ